jgi:hypothetical protein
MSLGFGFGFPRAVLKSGGPSLVLNFAGATSIDSRITFTRASTATYFDSAGVLQTAQNNVPRLTYNPSTLAPLGLLIEEQRTNSIRNNTMQGAAAGTPGTLPTNWSLSAGGGFTGMTSAVVGTGTESGITYIDLRFSGTPSASGTYRIYYEATNNIAALTGQTWSNSQYIKIAAGSLTGIGGFTDVYQEFTSAGGYITEAGVTTANPTTAGLATQRASTSRTLNGGATTAFVRTGLQVSLSSGVAIDITLRIGLPQLELGAFATSVIPTTTTAVTRSADAASMTGTNFSSWYTQSQGTVTADFAPAFQGSASLAQNNPGLWGITQSSLGSFNGYGVRLVPFSNFADAINGVARFAPSGLNNQVSFGPSAFLNFGQTYRTAFAWDSSQIAGTQGGIATVTTTNTAGAAMGTHNQLLIGQQNVGGTPTPLNGIIRSISYYPRRLSNAELRAITA